MMAKRIRKNKVKDYSSFKSFISLTLLQIKDKMKFSIRKPNGKIDVKTIIQKTVFFVLKFLLIGGAAGGLLFIINFLSIFTKTEYVNIFILFYTFLMILNLITNTYNLMKDLYYSDDNKVLVTMPVSSSQLFFSKIIVFVIQDLAKAFDILVPVTIGFSVVAVVVGQLTIPALFWCFIPMFSANLLLVVIAAFLSVPLLFIYKFLKSYPIAELIGLIVLVIVGVVLVILLIQQIPKDIDLINDWPKMRNDLQNAVNQFVQYIYPFAFVVRTMFGKQNTNLFFELNWTCFVDFAILVGILIILAVVAYFAIKPLYFDMMTKTFEFDKNVVGAAKKNVLRKRYITFTNKEFKLNFRDIEISGSYLVVYIATPLLLYFIDTVFSAITTRLEGDIMTYSFNLLLIILPYLASNSMIATMFSKEGRAAYMKKTKPISAFLPLTSKLFFNMLLSIPSIIGCAIVFGNFANIGWFPPIAIAISVLFVQYGHIFFSATRDIMNPQNEIYATNGEFTNNPNERTSTIVAFVMSFVLTGLTYFFLTESQTLHHSFTIGFIKLLIISAGIFASCLALYILYIKAYYYEK